MSKPFNFKRIAIFTFILVLAAVFTLEFGPGQRGTTAQKVSGEVVALVGNKKITLNDIRQNIDPETQQRLSSPELATFVEGYYLSILDRLVDAAFLEQQAPREGIAISNAELLAHLQQYPRFHKEGRFDPTTYQQQITQSRPGRTTVAFEQELRADMAREKLYQFLGHLGYVSEEEIHAEYLLSANKADVRFVRFSPAQLAVNIGKPTPKELSKFIEKNLKTLEEDYQKNIAEHTEPERLRLRQIFIERPASTPETTEPAPKEADELARKKAEELWTALQQGADFASLARNSSEQLETKDKGGDMGWVEAPQLPPLLANTVFNMKVGETSSLLETQNGYFIYKIEERSESHPKPFPAVQQEIALRLWTQQKSEMLARTEAQKALAELLNGKPLELLFPPTPAELGQLGASLPPQQPAQEKPTAVSTGLFGINYSSIPKLGEDEALQRLIFQTTTPGPIREIQTLGNDLLVLEVLERQHPTEEGFQNEKNNLREILQKYRMQRAQAELIQQMKAQEQPQLFPEKLKRPSPSDS
ncbi:MAG: SurA N-terminal domain-containing protein [Cystobacterineae bacterium]|nr:SurA N-terminal domain-containing protein [Cystobacterineae bacterium]